MRAKLCSIFVGLMLLLTAQVASAYTRTINGNIYFADERINVNNAYGSKLTGWYSQRPLRYVAYWVHAICPGREYQGAIKHTTASGSYIETFTTSCSNPGFRIYVGLESYIDGGVFHYVVDMNDTNPIYMYQFTIKDAQGDGFFRPAYGTGANETAWQSVNLSCPNDFTYTCNLPGDLHYDETAHKTANIYATGMDVGVFAGHYSSPTDPDDPNDPDDFVAAGPIFIYWPCPECADGNGTDGSYDRVLIREDCWHSNHRIAHEMGHIYMRRALGTKEVCDSGKLNYEPVTQGHQWDYGVGATTTSFEESAATSEGWANFFAVATYFEKDAAEPYYRWCTGLGTGENACITDSYSNALARAEGNDWQHYRDINAGDDSPCADYNDTNDHQNDGNVTRFFWDIYDNTNETSGPSSGYDNQSMDLDEMLEIWESFRGHKSGENKFATRGYLEYRSSCTGFDNRHGRNALDYRWVSYNSSSAPYYLPQHNLAPIYNLNCLLGQEEL